MKKLVNYSSGFILSLFFIVACSAPEVPDQVTKTFSEMFPHAKDISWKLDDDDVWEAEFSVRGKELEASFAANGDWIESERELEAEDIPERVKRSVTLKYPDWRISETEYVQKPNFSGYELNLEKGNKKTEVLVDAEGTIVDSKTEKEDNDD